jgi:hypothetical protein
MRSTEPERTRASVISSACSPVSGCEEVLELDPELGRVLDVERVLGVHERAGAAELLHLGDDLERERGLARGLGTIDLDDAATGQAAHAQGDVQAQGPGGHDLDVLGLGAFGQAHDGALAELLFDLGQRGVERLGAIGLGFDVVHFDDLVHWVVPRPR